MKPMESPQDRALRQREHRRGFQPASSCGFKHLTRPLQLVLCSCGTAWLCLPPVTVRTMKEHDGRRPYSLPQCAFLTDVCLSHDHDGARPSACAKHASPPTYPLQGAMSRDSAPSCPPQTQQSAPAPRALSSGSDGERYAHRPGGFFLL